MFHADPSMPSALGLVAETVITAMLTGFLIVGINLGYIFAARVIYAMSTDGLFFRQCRRVNRVGTPTPALTLAAAVALLAGAVALLAGDIAGWYGRQPDGPGRGRL